MKILSINNVNNYRNSVKQQVSSKNVSFSGGALWTDTFVKSGKNIGKSLTRDLNSNSVLVGKDAYINVKNPADKEAVQSKIKELHSKYYRIMVESSTTNEPNEVVAVKSFAIINRLKSEIANLAKQYSINPEEASQVVINDLSTMWNKTKSLSLQTEWTDRVMQIREAVDFLRGELKNIEKDTPEYKLSEKNLKNVEVTLVKEEANLKKIVEEANVKDSDVLLRPLRLGHNFVYMLGTDGEAKRAYSKILDLSDEYGKQMIRATLPFNDEVVTVTNEAKSRGVTLKTAMEDDVVVMKKNDAPNDKYTQSYQDFEYDLAYRELLGNLRETFEDSILPPENVALNVKREISRAVEEVRDKIRKTKSLKKVNELSEKIMSISTTQAGYPVNSPKWQWYENVRVDLANELAKLRENNRATVESKGIEFNDYMAIMENNAMDMIDKVFYQRKYDSAKLQYESLKDSANKQDRKRAKGYLGIMETTKRDWKKEVESNRKILQEYGIKDLKDESYKNSFFGELNL